MPALNTNMKRSLLFLTTCLLAFGCADKKAQEQKLRDSVMDMHERVMGEDEDVLKNKSNLDTLIKISADKMIKDSAKSFIDKLMMADSDMSTWMHNFEPDQTNKSHEQIMSYFGNQKRQITHIDSEMGALISQSAAYLAKHAKK